MTMKTVITVDSPTPEEAAASFKHPNALKASKLLFVSQNTLDNFIAAIGGTVETVSTKGRCIEVRFVKGPFPTKLELVDRLYGNGRPCDDFNLEGNTICARLKTIIQEDADANARVIDAMRETPDALNRSLGEFVYDKATDIFHLLEPIFERATQPAPTPTRGEKKKNGKKIPTGAATIVMRTMEKECAHGQIDVEKLTAKTLKHMTPKLDPRNVDRNPGYVATAIQKLVELEFLFVHGEQVSLSKSWLGFFRQDDKWNDCYIFPQ